MISPLVPLEDLRANKIVLDLIHKVLDLQEYDTIISALETSNDIELILNYILWVRIFSDC